MPITTVQLGASLAGNESSLATSTQSLPAHEIGSGHEVVPIDRAMFSSCWGSFRLS